MHEVISGHYKREMECLVMDIQRAGPFLMHSNKLYANFLNLTEKLSMRTTSRSHEMLVVDSARKVIRLIPHFPRRPGP